MNIMAGECVFDWDLRVVPGDDANIYYDKFLSFSGTLEQVMKEKSSDCSIKTEWITEAPAFSGERDTHASDLAMQITGHNQAEVVSYATEAGQFEAEGLSVVVCGPGSIEQAHQANEFISIDQLQQGAQFIRNLIKRLSA